jgi:DNA sulfur modification protein DndC
MKLADRIKEITKEIQDIYLADNDPWVIGYSGGKDSTAVLQLVLYALARLPKEQLTKEVHVLTNDTLVENPTVVQYVDEQLAMIEEVGKAKLFPHNPDLFKTIKVVPRIEDRFWINMIGRGYPPPSRWFRWCTERMKITPANDYIKKQVGQHGRVILVLGTRKSESVNRSKSMEKYDIEEITGSKLRKHVLPNAWMFAPVVDLTTPEVWQYLMAVPSFWGGDNKKLVAMYRNASDSATECPLVVDTSTPSCGNSRFGCWVCTVVSRDKSMENLIENGEDWMVSLLEFRDYLTEVRYDENKRMAKNRMGQDALGPFLFEVRAELLEKVFRVEEETGLEVISKQELAAIQSRWRLDGSYNYHVADIYFKVKQKRIAMIETQKDELREWEEFELLSDVAKENEVDANHLLQLLAIEKEFAPYSRRGNIFNEMQKKIEIFAGDN